MQNNPFLCTLRHLMNCSPSSQRLLYLCFGRVMSPGDAACYRFICAEKGTGGWRAPWPLERAVISPAIMWLRPTPSRQKSKASFSLLCLVVSLLVEHMRERTHNCWILQNFLVFCLSVNLDGLTFICFLVESYVKRSIPVYEYEATISSQLA